GGPAVVASRPGGAAGLRGLHGRPLRQTTLEEAHMRNVSGNVRAGAAVLGAAGLAVGATRVSGSVQLATPGERVGLPESSSVLLDSASLVCPGQQRLGATGLRDVKGEVTVAAASPDP